MLVSVGLALSGLSELARNSAIVYVAGVFVADGVFAAASVSVAVTTVMTAVARTAVTPLLAIDGGRARFRSLLGWFCLCSITIAVLIACFPGPVAGFIAQGMQAEQQREVERLLLPSAVVVALAPIAGVGGAMLNAERSFVLPSLERLVRSLFVIVSVVVIPARVTAPVIGWAIAAGMVFQSLLILWALRRLGCSVVPTLRLDAVGRQGFQGVGLLTGGYIAGQMVTLVERSLASTLPGGISTMSVAPQLVLSSAAMISAGLQTVVLADLAAIDRNTTRIGSLVEEATWSGLGFVIPGMTVLVVGASGLLSLLEGRGIDAMMGSRIIAIYSLGVPFSIVGQMAAVPFYAAGDTRTPLIQMLMNSALNCVLAFVLHRAYGLHGLALAAMFTFVANAIAMRAKLRRMIGDVHGGFLKRARLGPIGVVALSAGSATAVVDWMARSMGAGLAYASAGGIGAGLVAAVLVGLAVNADGPPAFVRQVLGRAAK